MTSSVTQSRAPGKKPQFVDLFAGCGGLSLGLMLAGWRGLLAVEQDSEAFKTLEYNLVKGSNRQTQYEWPDWFEKKPAEISRFIKDHKEALSKLRGQIDLIAGGPPCQGFSFAGRRKSSDPRNGLFRHYVRLVRLLRPSFVLLENVKGISVAFRGARKKGKQKKPFSEQIKQSLRRAGYKVFTRLVRGVDVGVPQFRPRYILVAVRRDLVTGWPDFDPFEKFDDDCLSFLERKGLPANKPITVGQAISDLRATNNGVIDSEESPGFKQIRYGRPSTVYQRILHGKMNGTAPNSLRLANHKKEIRLRFEEILRTCRHGVQLSEKDRKRFALKKHCIVPLDARKPSHTLTTLPDDFLHYSEPRILTVREYARLQSFPDWYEFHGKYTTGGDRRLKECPRYTQAGNAVPPFLAEVVGRMLKRIRRNVLARCKAQ